MFTAKVTRIEDKGNFVTASIYTSEKDRDGEWQTHFFDAIFLGGCVAKSCPRRRKPVRSFFRLFPLVARSALRRAR